MTKKDVVEEMIKTLSNPLKRIVLGKRLQLSSAQMAYIRPAALSLLTEIIRGLSTYIHYFTDSVVGMSLAHNSLNLEFV